MFYTVEHGVDCFEVGVQQLLDWMGWSDYHRDSFVGNYTLASYISYVNVDFYVVVEGVAFFGDMLCPCVCAMCRNLDDAAEFASSQCDSDGDEFRHEYEVWHVMDDGDLWQAWDHDAELSRIDVPVVIDSWYDEDSDGRYRGEDLVSCFVPSVGQRVAFLKCFASGVVRYYAPNDWQSLQPRSFGDTVFYDWLPLDEFEDDIPELVSVGLLSDDCSDTLDLLCQLRDAGSIDGGGRVGATC